MEALRKCRKCSKEAHTEEDLTLFIKGKDAKYGRSNLCTVCAKHKNRKWEANNRDKVNRRGKEARARNKERAIEAKGGACVHCGIQYDGTNSVIFDFHHLDPSEKEFNPGTMMKCSWEKIEKEIDKCVLLCANCHRLEHK